MPAVSSRREAADTVLDDQEENDENVPPTQGRRSQRVKGRKSASTANHGHGDVQGEVDNESVEDGEENEIDEEDQEDQDDDEEVEKPRKRARKSPPAQGRRRAPAAKTNGVSKTAKAKKPRKSRKSDAAQVEENTNESPMLEALLDDKVALDATILEWIERYEDDKTAAMTEMINFILRCCGCPFEIRPEDVDDEDNITDTLAEIQEAYKNTNPREYPLISNKKAQYRKFPKRLSEYFRRLLQKLSDKGMLDEEPSSVLDKIQQWVFSLSSTNFRPFRHTATVISLGFITTLCDVYAKVNKAHDAANVLLEKEKKGKRGGAGRAKNVETMAQEQESQLRVLTELMESTYDSVFVHRFRDVDHRIRTECVHELGIWMNKLPQVYFDGAHLRYMGWALSDSNAATRLDVVKSLQKLYESDEYISNLRHFTERFLSRFIEMATSDADRGVRVATIVLLDNLRQRDLLEGEDIDKISLMIFDPEGRIRKAVAGIFVSNVEGVYEETLEGIGGHVETVESILGDDKESADGVPHTWLKFNALVKVLTKFDGLVEEAEKEGKEGATDKVPFKGFEFGEVESRIAMAASAIIPEMGELQDWDNLASYLLRDHSPKPTQGRNVNSIVAKARKACTLSASEEILLLEVLNVAVRLRRDYEDEHEDTKGKKRKRGDDAVEEDAEVDVSTGLVLKLPLLIRRFGSKPETAAQILRLVQHVKLDKYDELRQLEALETLLEDVGKQFMNHTDMSVFKQASASLLHAQKFESLGHVTEPKVIELQDEVNTSFLSMVNGKDLETGYFAAEELSDLTTATARLENLLAVSDCTVAVGDENTKQGKSTFSLLTELVGRAIIGHDTEEIEMIAHALTSLRWYFMWRVRSITSAESDSAPETEALNDLQEKRIAVLDNLTQILDNRPADEVRIQAASLLLDLYTIFTTVEQSLRNDILQGESQLSTKLQDTITNVLEEEINLLHSSEKKASNIVRGDDDDDEQQEEDDEEMADVANLPPETRGAIHERRICELAARMTLAVLGGVVPKTFAQTLLRHKGKVGQSYDRVIVELGVVVEKPVVKVAKPAETEVIPDVVEDVVVGDAIEVASQMDDA